jgi:membrane protein YdbS with pleckstrin-like domain
MSIWAILVLVLVLCLVVWLARGYIPAPINNFVIIAATIIVILVLLWGIGLFDAGHTIRIR